MRLSIWLLAIAILSVTPRLGAEDKYFDSKGVRIRYVDEGTGEPVVLIHGHTSNIEVSWIDTGVLPILAKHHRVVALDLRGHGKSGKPHEPEAYGAEMA